jgi:hypothetical protein
MNFNLINLVITVRTDDAFQLCHCLPLLGNEFAAACRKISCLTTARDCDSCSRQASCAWNLVFGQKLSTDPSALKRFQKPSLPFIFTFPSRQSLPDKPTEIECGLVVIGTAIQGLEMLLEGFNEILFPLAAEILLVGTRDYQDTVHLLAKGSGINCSENLIVLSSKDLLGNCCWTGSCIRIQLVSSLRLIEDGRLQGAFNFSRFARTLLRRVSSLAYYYGACEYNFDFKELSAQADAVICTDNHFFVTSGENRKLSGLSGYGSFSGDFSGLMPFLAAGLYVHIGKGATFGMGRYELLPDTVPV